VKKFVSLRLFTLCAMAVGCMSAGIAAEAPVRGADRRASESFAERREPLPTQQLGALRSVGQTVMASRRPEEGAGEMRDPIQAEVDQLAVALDEVLRLEAPNLRSLPIQAAGTQRAAAAEAATVDDSRIRSRFETLRSRAAQLRPQQARQGATPAADSPASQGLVRRGEGWQAEIAEALDSAPAERYRRLSALRERLRTRSLREEIQFERARAGAGEDHPSPGIQTIVEHR